MLRKVKILFSFLALSFVFATAVSAQPEFPDALKDAFTQYPESAVGHTITAEGMVQAILDCGNVPMNTVYEYYKDELSSAGWGVNTEVKSAEMIQLFVTRDGQDGMIVIAGEDGQTSVVLSLSAKK